MLQAQMGLTRGACPFALVMLLLGGSGCNEWRIQAGKSRTAFSFRRRLCSRISTDSPAAVLVATYNPMLSLQVFFIATSPPPDCRMSREFQVVFGSAPLCRFSALGFVFSSFFSCLQRASFRVPGFELVRWVCLPASPSLFSLVFL